ncbi:SIMPL domain-containing protein [Sporosarcina sp. CAU 1771]
MEVIYYSYVQPTIQRTKRVMTVNGTGSVTLPPDTVQFYVEVQTENEKLTIAQQENASAMNKVIEALLDFGIENEHIQTVSYNITPQYDYIDGEQQFRGYAVSNVIMVTSGYVEKIGSMIDLAVENGATGISNIQFLVSDEEATYEKALSEALDDAKKKAQTMANTIQIQIDLIPIKIVEEQKEAPIIPRMFVAKEMSATTPIEPGQLTIRASVTVQFQY